MIDSVTQRGGPRERSRFERELSDLGLTPAAEREAAPLRAAVSRASTRFDPIAASRRNRYFADTLGWKKRANASPVCIARIAGKTTNESPLV